MNVSAIDVVRLRADNIRPYDNAAVNNNLSLNAFIPICFLIILPYFPAFFKCGKSSCLTHKQQVVGHSQQLRLFADVEVIP